MPKTKHYNVYDGDKLVLAYAKSSEVKVFIGNPKFNLYTYVNEGCKAYGRYTIICAEDEKNGYAPFNPKDFAEKWEAVCKPFRNVIWVQSGGRKISLWGE